MNNLYRILCFNSITGNRFLSVAFFVLMAACTAQAGDFRNFKTNDNVFIKNEGIYAAGKQFGIKQDVLAFVNRGNTGIYFTKTGFYYVWCDYNNPVFKDEKEEEEKKDGKENVEYRIEKFRINFENADFKNSQLVFENKQNLRLKYLLRKNGTSKVVDAPAYSKIIYKNIYKGIDLEFILGNDNELKYSFIVKPYADASKIKFSYPDAESLRKGCLNYVKILSSFGHFTDHHLTVNYLNSAERIHSNYKVDKKSISFAIDDYDKSKSIIIDPWIVSPNFTPNSAYEIKQDKAGNVYVYGGQTAVNLNKYTSQGNLIWSVVAPQTFNPAYLGDMEIDDSCNVYITAIVDVTKLDSASNQIWYYQTTGGSNATYEFWRLSIDKQKQQLFYAGGTTQLMAARVDLFQPNVAVPSLVNTVNEEATGLCRRRSNDDLIVMARTNIHIADTQLNFLQSINAGFSLVYGGPNYNPYGGRNIIDNFGNFIYATDGGVLKRFDVTTGTLMNTIPVPGGSFQLCGGLTVDDCGFVYVGSQNRICKYDSLLNLIDTITTQGAVYDLSVASGGNILACGAGFAAMYDKFNTCMQSYYMNVCIGDTTNFVVNDSIYFLFTAWEFDDPLSGPLNTATGFNVSHVFTQPGKYDVQAYYGLQSGMIDTVVYHVTVDSAVWVTLGPDTVLCPGIIYNLTCSTNAVNYFWWNGSTDTSMIVGMAGDYWVVVTNGACVATDTINIQYSAFCSPIINFSSSDSTFCEKQCIDFYDQSFNNPISWQWLFPGANPASSTDQYPTNICYNNYGSFPVTLIACNASGCDTLTIANFIVELQNPTDSIWQSNDTLYSLPAYSYQWYEITNGLIAGATDSFYVYTQPGSYYCVVSDTVGCVATSNNVVIVGLTDPPAPQWGVLTVVPNPNDGIFEIILNNEQVIKDSELKIFNATGQLVFRKNISSNRIQIKSQLPVGVYSILVSTSNGIISKKFEVVK